MSRLRLLSVVTLAINAFRSFGLQPQQSQHLVTRISGRCRFAHTLRAAPDSNVQAAPDSDFQLAIAAIVKDELKAISLLSAEAQEAALPNLISRVEERAAAEGVDEETRTNDGNTNVVVDTARGEVKRLLANEWSLEDLSLLLRFSLFLGAGVAAPTVGIAVMPVAALLATYGAALRLELGVRVVQEVAVRASEMAKQGVVDGVKDYTGKQAYEFGDITTETIRRATGSDDYAFGDLTKEAVQKAGRVVTGNNEYVFGDLTKDAVQSAGEAVTGFTGKKEYRFGDVTKRMLGGLLGREPEKGDEGGVRGDAKGSDRGGNRPL